MKRHIGILAAALCCIIASQTSYEASAQETGLRGTFTLNVRASSLAQWPDVWPDLKPKLRPQAEALTFVFQTQLMSTFNQAETLSSNLLSGGADTLRTSSSARQTQWTFKQQVLDVSTEWENGVMTRTFKAEDGQRVETYRFNADRSVLTVNVSISMSAMKKPVIFALVYNEV